MLEVYFFDAAMTFSVCGLIMYFDVRYILLFLHLSFNTFQELDQEKSVHI